MKVWVVVHEEYIPYSVDYRTIRGVFATEAKAIAFVDGQAIRKSAFEIEEHEVQNAAQ